MQTQKKTIELIMEWGIKGAILTILGLVVSIHKSQFLVLATLQQQQDQINLVKKALDQKVNWANMQRIELRLKEDKKFTLLSNAIRIERESSP